MNHERKRVDNARAGLRTALRQLELQGTIEAARFRANRLSWLAGGGLAAGFIATLVPLRAWPRIAVNVAQVGLGLIRLPLVSLLVPIASKRLLRGAKAES